MTSDAYFQWNMLTLFLLCCGWIIHTFGMVLYKRQFPKIQIVLNALLFSGILLTVCFSIKQIIK
jgi:hypothetical protein